MVAEVIGGLLSGSLALLADAGHMLTDTVSLFLAWIAARMAHKPADTLRSYGYHRVQILAAFINGVFFILIVGWITYEAVQRILKPVEVMGDIMLVIAGLGLIVNLLAFFILHGAGGKDLNIRAALLHVLGDLLGSVAAITAAVIILGTGWMPIDPILSVFVALLILRSAWMVVKESSHILLEGTPQDIDVEDLQTAIVEAIPCVHDVHHVHVWSLTPEHPLLTLHVNVDPEADLTQVLQRVKQVLHDRFQIHHSTVQVEPADCVDEQTDTTSSTQD